MNRKLLALYVALAMGLLVFFLWTARIWPFNTTPEPVDVSVAELDAELDTVRIQGTAHYEVRVSVVRPARLGSPESTWWLYPVFDRGDINGRTITAMAYCPDEPEALVTYEDVTLEAWALPSGAMPPGAASNFQDRGYAFADGFVVLECVAP